MIEVEVADSAWTDALADAEAVVLAAAQAAQGADRAGIAILLTDDAALAALNQQYRSKPGPTNVLSFPAPPNPEDHLGDIALAFGVCAREAAEQGKTLADHLRHLTVHGVLHLMGYDHMTDEDAVEMEALEREILAGMGVADPYGADHDID